MESLANRVDSYEERGKFPARLAQRGFREVFALVEAVLMPEDLGRGVSAIGKTPGGEVGRAEQEIRGVKFCLFPGEYNLAWLVIAVRSLDSYSLALGAFGRSRTVGMPSRFAVLMVSRAAQGQT